MPTNSNLWETNATFDIVIESKYSLLAIKDEGTDMDTENVHNLKQQIDTFAQRLRQLSDTQMEKTLGDELWSGKELLGHMSDSAAMNRQRIVRSQYEELYDFPFYDQPQWTTIQAYNKYNWDDLVMMWEVEYRHLVHILENLPDKSASDRCHIKFGSSDWVTLDWLVGHIYRHNDHHLQQLFWIAGDGNLPDDRELYEPIEQLP